MAGDQKKNRNVRKQEAEENCSSSDNTWRLLAPRLAKESNEEVEKEEES